LTSVTLEPESWHEFDGAPFAPYVWAVAPDGEELYALSGDESPYLGRMLLRINATSGTARHLATLPETGAALAATREALFVVSPGAGAVWMVDHLGHVTNVLPAGQRPLALTLWGA
jgi:hypothetical protein